MYNCLLRRYPPIRNPRFRHYFSGRGSFGCEDVYLMCVIQRKVSDSMDSAGRSVIVYHCAALVGFSRFP